MKLSYIKNTEEITEERNKRLLPPYEETNNKTYEELCSMRIGDMNRAELYDFAQGLLNEVWDFEKRINKAIEYIEKHIKYECDAQYGELKFMSHHLYGNFKKEDLLKILKGE